MACTGRGVLPLMVQTAREHAQSSKQKTKARPTSAAPQVSRLDIGMLAFHTDALPHPDDQASVITLPSNNAACTLYCAATSSVKCHALFDDKAGWPLAPVRRVHHTPSTLFSRILCVMQRSGVLSDALNFACMQQRKIGILMRHAADTICTI